jgi:hypothetical protein
VVINLQIICAPRMTRRSLVYIVIQLFLLTLKLQAVPLEISHTVAGSLLPIRRVSSGREKICALLCHNSVDEQAQAREDPHLL